MAITGNVGGMAPDIIQRYILNADQYKAEIKDVAKAVRKQEKHEKDLKKIMDAVAKSEDKTTAATKKLSAATVRNTSITNKNTTAKKKQATASKNMAKAATLAKGALVGLAAGGVALLTKALVDSLKEADRFTQAQKIYTGDIKSARVATQGLAKDIDIMVAKNRLATLGVKMTDAEFNKMLGHLTKISGAMSIDLKFALESATTMLARQSTAVADNVGVVIKAEQAYKDYAASIGTTSDKLTASQKKIAFQKEALSQLSNKAGELGDRTKTAGSELTKLGNILSTAASKAASAVGRWKPFVDMISGLAVAARQAARDLGMIHSGKVKTPELRAELGRQLNEARAAVQSYGVDPDSPVIRKNLPTVTKQSINRQLAKMRLAQKRLDALSRQSATKRAKAARAQELAEFRAAQAQAYKDTAPAAKPKTKLKKTRMAKGAPQRTIVDQIAGTGALPGFGKLFGKEYTGTPQGPEGGFQFDESKMSGLQKYAGASNAAVKADLARADALRQANAAMKEGGEWIQSTGVSSLANFAGGLWAAADAAIQGGDSMGLAVAKMVKATLLGVAQEATVKAIFYAAEGLAAAASFNYASAAKYFSAAGMMGAVAAGSGAVGLALSSATAGGGASKKKATTTKKETAYRPGFGKAVESTRAIVLNVYVNDPANPSSKVITDAMLQRAANA